MGGIGSNGVEVRKASIRIKFTFEGVRHGQTVMLNGEPMKPTAPNVRYAHRLAAEIKQKITHGTFSMAESFPASDSGGTLTVGSHLDIWLATQRIEDSTKEGYKSVIRFWKSVIGTKPLRSLKHSHILLALAERPDLSGKTINNRMSVLREALALAVHDNILTVNPATAIASSTWQRVPIDPFTSAEVERILAAISDPQVRNYITFKFFTGLRPGESFGLRWSNVDLASGHVVISESVVGGKEKSTTKTKRVRTVLLNSRALEALRSQKAHTFLEGGHVFHDPRDNKRWGGEPKFRWYWVPLLKRLGIRHRPPYNTRHTYATMMLMAGMKSAFCAGQMGHSVIIFHSTYAKWIPGDGDNVEMAKLEKAISGFVPRVSPEAASD